MRFIHTSDWQLGMTRHFLSQEAQARFLQDRIDAIRTIGELARTHEAAFVVVAGDVLESNQLSRQTVVRTLEALATVPVPVYLLPGNHDPLDAASIFNSTAFRDAPDHIHIIHDATPVPVPGLDKVEVVGAPWRSKRPVSDLCSDMLGGLAPSGQAIRIAVAHGQLDELAPDVQQPGTISLAQAEAALRDGRIHYLALGDRHSVTRVGETSAIWYSGAPVATDFDEVEPNHILLVDLDAGIAPSVTELPVGRWRFIAHEETINGTEDVARVRRWLGEQPDKERSVVKIAFTGTVNLTTAAALDAVLADYQDHFASLRRRERTSDLVIAPDAFDEDSVSLTGYAQAAWNELVAAAIRDDESGREAREALALFYRLAGGSGA